MEYYFTVFFIIEELIGFSKVSNCLLPSLMFFWDSVIVYLFTLFFLNPLNAHPLFPLFY